MLLDKIILIYPSLAITDFSPTTGTILLQNDSDDKGDYIARWSHPTYPQPTEQQLAGVK